MPLPLRNDRAVRYACAVLADFQVGRLPVDPFVLAEQAGLTMLPLSAVENHPMWVDYDLRSALKMTVAVTLSYPAFCIVYRDDVSDLQRLRYALCHELGHLFMNHYRDYPDLMGASRPANASLEAEADAFACNLLAPVPVVDVIRFNRPQQARASLFGMSRSAWMRRLNTLDQDRACLDVETADWILFQFREYLLGRRCVSCGQTFVDEEQQNRCPFCGTAEIDWTLD